VRPRIISFGPLILDGKNVTFSLEYRFVNSGKSPANSFDAMFEVEPGFGKTEQHDGVCRFAEMDMKMSKNAINQKTIFPGGEDDLNLVWSAINPLTDDYAIPIRPYVFIPERWFVAQIFGCIVYKMAFDDKIHHTWVAFNIWKTIDGKTIDWKFPQTIEAGRIRLDYSPNGWNKAD
jgi:hypothetical protein